MGFEMALLLFAAVAIAAYGLIRRGKEKELEERVRQVITCQVTYRDREKTIAFLNAYFESNLISVLSVNSFIEGGEEIDLYTNVYRLFLPASLTAAELVVHLSGCSTVQSVHINPV